MLLAKACTCIREKCCRLSNFCWSNGGAVEVTRFLPHQSQVPNITLYGIVIFPPVLFIQLYYYVNVHFVMTATGWLPRVNPVIAVYAVVKAQTSLAPLSRFRGSHITTAHEQQCCRFQSYAKTVPSPMKLTSEIDKA